MEKVSHLRHLRLETLQLLVDPLVLLQLVDGGPLAVEIRAGGGNTGQGGKESRPRGKAPPPTATVKGFGGGKAIFEQHWREKKHPLSTAASS